MTRAACEERVARASEAACATVCGVRRGAGAARANGRRWSRAGVAAACALALAGSARAGEGNACDYYMAPGGDGTVEAGGGVETDPFGSLEAAQLALRPGDTLCVKSGTYEFNTFVGAEILVRGNSTHPITIRGERDGPYSDLPKFKFSGGVAIDFRGAEYVNLEGVEVDGGAGEVSLEDVLSFSWWRGKPGPKLGKMCFRLREKSRHIKISRCACHDVSHMGVNIMEAFYATVAYNAFYRIGWYRSTDDFFAIKKTYVPESNENEEDDYRVDIHGNAIWNVESHLYHREEHSAVAKFVSGPTISFDAETDVDARSRVAQNLLAFNGGIELLFKYSPYLFIFKNTVYSDPTDPDACALTDSADASKIILRDNMFFAGSMAEHAINIDVSLSNNATDDDSFRNNFIGGGGRVNEQTAVRIKKLADDVEVFASVESGNFTVLSDVDGINPLEIPGVDDKAMTEMLRVVDNFHAGLIGPSHWRVNHEEFTKKLIATAPSAYTDVSFKQKDRDTASVVFRDPIAGEVFTLELHPEYARKLFETNASPLTSSDDAGYPINKQDAYPAHEQDALEEQDAYPADATNAYPADEEVAYPADEEVAYPANKEAKLGRSGHAREKRKSSKVIRTLSANSGDSVVALGEEETTGYPASGTSDDGTSATGAPASGYPASGYPASGYPASGYPASGYPASGYPASGYPASGYPASGYPTTNRYPASGYPTEGSGSPNKSRYPQGDDVVKQIEEATKDAVMAIKDATDSAAEESTVKQKITDAANDAVEAIEKATESATSKIQEAEKDAVDDAAESLSEAVRDATEAATQQSAQRSGTQHAPPPHQPPPNPPPYPGSIEPPSPPLPPAPPKMDPERGLRRGRIVIPMKDELKDFLMERVEQVDASSMSLDAPDEDVSGIEDLEPECYRPPKACPQVLHLSNYRSEQLMKTVEETSRYRTANQVPSLAASEEQRGRVHEYDPNRANDEDDSPYGPNMDRAFLAALGMKRQAVFKSSEIVAPLAVALVIVAVAVVSERFGKRAQNEERASLLVSSAGTEREVERSRTTRVRRNVITASALAGVFIVATVTSTAPSSSAVIRAKAEVAKLGAKLADCAGKFYIVNLPFSSCAVKGSDIAVGARPFPLEDYIRFEAFVIARLGWGGFWSMKSSGYEVRAAARAHVVEQLKIKKEENITNGLIQYHRQCLRTKTWCLEEGRENACCRDMPVTPVEEKSEDDLAFDSYHSILRNLCGCALLMEKTPIGCGQIDNEGRDMYCDRMRILGLDKGLHPCCGAPNPFRVQECLCLGDTNHLKYT